MDVTGAVATLQVIVEVDKTDGTLFTELRHSVWVTLLNIKIALLICFGHLFKKITDDDDGKCFFFENESMYSYERRTHPHPYPHPHPSPSLALL